MAEALVMSQYYAPGVYIGRQQIPNPVASAQARLPCIVGKGSRLQTSFDTPIRRSYRNAVQLTFGSAPPYQASLGSAPAQADKTKARLYTQIGSDVPLNYWEFAQSVPGSGIYDLVIIQPSRFDPSATYYLDYQSTSRALLDSLPFAALREIIAVGDVPQQSRYLEGRDYTIPVEYTGWVNGVDNTPTYQTPRFSAVVQTGAGTGAMAPTVATSYTHTAMRRYTVYVRSVASPNVTFSWSAEAKSGQDVSDAIPNVPNVVGATEPSWPSVTVNMTSGTGSLVLTDPTTGTDLGVVFTLTGLAGTWTPTDTYSFSAIPPQRIDFDPTCDNTNQFPVLGDINPTTNVATTGSITYNRDSAYTGTTNRRYVITCTAVVVGPPKTATFAWQGIGEGAVTSGTFTLNSGTASTLTRVLLENGLYIDGAFGSGNFTVNDRFDFSVLAPQTFPASKDDRAYTLTVTAASAGTVGIQYLATTIEGGFNLTAATYANGGKFVLPGGVSLYARNIGSLAAEINYAVNDVFEGSLALAGTIEWNRAATNTETFNTSSILTDTIGLVTGVPGAQYTALQYPPIPLTYTERYTVPSGASTFTVVHPGVASVAGTPVMSVTNGGTPLTRVTGTPSAGQYTLDAATGLVSVNVASGTELVVTYLGSAINHVVIQSTRVAVPYTVVLDSAGQPTPYVRFTGTVPTALFEIAYLWRGIEPDVGQFYYMTVNLLRPTSMYNQPKTAYDEPTLRQLLGPAEATNDLYIAGQLMMADNGSPGVMWVQVADANGDGSFSPTDYQAGIDATESTGRLTDVIVLNGFNVLADQLSSNERMNDPFERKDRALWVGTPSGTAIGDAETPNTLVYLSRRTMQVYGNSPAHGMRVLLANTYATKDLVLPTGTVITVNLDGSFIAAATAGLNASFQDPNTMLLRKQLNGFTSMQTFSEAEELQLGAASVLFLHDNGSGVYAFGESTTVDTSSISNNEINVSINETQYVTRTMREGLDSTMISFVPNTMQEGIAAITGAAASILFDLVGRGIIGPYVDDSGNVRPLNPDTDIVVQRSATRKTDYRLLYYFCGKYGIKRIAGSYSIDAKFWEGNGAFTGATF